MGAYKLRRAARDQVEVRFASIDDLIPADHRVRMVWAYVERLDISALLARRRSFVGATGAPATDPCLLLALWLFATLDGVGSAREIDRLSRRDLAYQWILGGVSVNYHTLADFRAEAGPFLADVLAKSVAALAEAGIVDLDCLAVDSCRVKANAGSASFRRRPTLEELHAAAREKIEGLGTALSGQSLRRRKAQERAAREREQKVAAALEAVSKIEAARAAEALAQRRRTPRKSKPPRASTTDPQARIMAMPGGGFAPGYNLQIKTDPKAGAIVGLEVNAKASDRGQLTAAVAQIEQRHGRRPKAILADDGYDAREDIEAVETGGTAVYLPLPKDEAKQAIKPSDGPGVRQWKTRMVTETAKAVYALRINTEHSHAHMRNHGLSQMPVRGLAKVTAVALLFAVAVNLLLYGPTLLAA